MGAPDPLAPAYEVYIKQINTLHKDYQNQLDKLNKEKGFDPKIYAQIVAADELLEQEKEALIKLKKAGEAIREHFANVRRLIKVINTMKPKAPTTFPERCADPKLANQYTLVEGFIDKSAAGGWSLKTFDGTKEYPISKDVGLIGQGTLINPSSTPQDMREQGWIDKKKGKKGEVVCLSVTSK